MLCVQVPIEKDSFEACCQDEKDITMVNKYRPRASHIAIPMRGVSANLYSLVQYCLRFGSSLALLKHLLIGWRQPLTDWRLKIPLLCVYEGICPAWPIKISTLHKSGYPSMHHYLLIPSDDDKSTGWTRRTIRDDKARATSSWTSHHKRCSPTRVVAIKAQTAIGPADDAADRSFNSSADGEALNTKTLVEMCRKARKPFRLSNQKSRREADPKATPRILNTDPLPLPDILQLPSPSSVHPWPRTMLRQSHDEAISTASIHGQNFRVRAKQTAKITETTSTVRKKSTAPLDASQMAHLEAPEKTYREPHARHREKASAEAACTARHSHKQSR